MSIRFVAMTTLMLCVASNPSNWFSNSSMVRCTSLSPMGGRGREGERGKERGGGKSEKREEKKGEEEEEEREGRTKVYELLTTYMTTPPPPGLTS